MEGGVLNGQIGQFFFAGFETLTATMSFALYELALNPEIQRKVKDEIVTKLNENNGKIDYQVFNYDLVYLDQTIKETLRKYPLLPLLDRRATKDYHVPNSDLILEEGIPVYISLYGLHNDEKYFPNPEIFDPDRFSKENIQKIPNYVFLPFGGGQKICIGERYALLAMKVGLVNVLSNYDVEKTENTPTIMEYSTKSITLAPKNDLLLRFKEAKIITSLQNEKEEK